MRIKVLLITMGLCGQGYSTVQSKDQVPSGDLAPAAAVSLKREVSPYPVQPPFMRNDICLLDEKPASNLLKVFQIDSEYLDTDSKFIDYCISNLYNVIKENDAGSSHFEDLQKYCYGLIKNDYDNGVPIEKTQAKISLFLLSSFIETLNFVANKENIAIPDHLQIALYSLGSTKDNTAYMSYDTKSDIDLLVTTNQYDSSIKKLFLEYRNYVEKFKELISLDDLNGPYRRAEDQFQFHPRSLLQHEKELVKKLKEEDLDFTKLEDPFVLLPKKNPKPDQYRHLWKTNTPRFIGGNKNNNNNNNISGTIHEQTTMFFMKKPQPQMLNPILIPKDLELTDKYSKKDYLKNIGAGIRHLYASIDSNKLQGRSTRLTEPSIFKQLEIIRSELDIADDVINALTRTLNVLIYERSNLESDISCIKEDFPVIIKFLRDCIEPSH